MRRLVSGQILQGGSGCFTLSFSLHFQRAEAFALNPETKLLHTEEGCLTAPAQDCQFIDYLQRIKPISNPIVTEVNPHTNIIGKVLSISFMQGYC